MQGLIILRSAGVCCTWSPRSRSRQLYVNAGRVHVHDVHARHNPAHETKGWSEPAVALMVVYLYSYNPAHETILVSHPDADPRVAGLNDILKSSKASSTGSRLASFR
jgi:hypothetical protein